jgi:hypothetical protein
LVGSQKSDEMTAVKNAGAGFLGILLNNAEQFYICEA